MNDIQLKYADHCIDKLFVLYPKSGSLSSFFNNSRFNESELVISILKRDSFIERKGVGYIMTDFGHLTIETHSSYSNYINNKNVYQIELYKKEQLETKISELTKTNLTLQNKHLRTKMLFSIIGFIFGFIAANWKDILIILKIISPVESK